MFNSTFFPTPIEVAKKMLADVKIEYSTLILDPGGGKGDLLDYLREYKRVGKNLFACEIQPELKAILVDKGYPVLAEDFLTYKPSLFFTLIVMNPPFDEAEDHIFHAWEILGEGDLISLVNASSLEGKFRKEQILLELISKYGSYEVIGPAFKNAERTTDIDVAIVRLHKEACPFKIDFDPITEHNYHFSSDIGPESGLAIPGFVPGLVASFNASMNQFESYLKARLLLEKALGSTLRGSHGEDPLEAADDGNVQDRYNNFTSRLRDKAWNTILDHPNFQHMLTARARQMMKRFQAQQHMLDFNVHNIKEMFGQIIAMSDKLLEAAIDDAFDIMTKYHRQNRVHIEGWKSDIAWKVNHKVVLPYFVETRYHYDDSKIRLSYDRYVELGDIDRAMCVISKKPYNDIQTIGEVLGYNGDFYPGVAYSSTFFKIRGYKKGTLHLEFRDRQLLADFNYWAARNKGWLPEKDTKTYAGEQPENKTEQAKNKVASNNARQSSFGGV